MTYPCGLTASGYDCAEPAGCNGAYPKSWAIGGTLGDNYDVTFRVRGVVEVTSYVGGTRDAGSASIQSNPDLFHRGGAAQDSTGPSYDYNTYTLRVSPAFPGAENVYFLNSVTLADNPHTVGSSTAHLTFPIDYTKTIAMTAGATVTLTMGDSNCNMEMNCGPNPGTQCSNPRTVSLSGATPAAPASFLQPFSNSTGKYGQWLFFDITNVTLIQ